MAKPTNAANAIPYPHSANDRTSRRMRSSFRNECRNAVLHAWMRETDEELRLALREGRARVVSAVDDAWDAPDSDMYDA